MKRLVLGTLVVLLLGGCAFPPDKTSPGGLRPSIQLNNELTEPYRELFGLRFKQAFDRAGHVIKQTGAGQELSYELLSVDRYPLRYDDANQIVRYHMRMDMKFTLHANGDTRTVRTYRETRYSPVGEQAETRLDAVERLAQTLSKDAVTFVNEGAVRMEHCCREYPYPDEELPDPANLSGH